MIFLLKEKIVTIKSECSPCPATQLTNSSTPTWMISIFPPATTSGKPYPPMLQISVPLKSSETQLYPKELWWSSSSPNLPLYQIQEMESVFPILYFPRSIPTSSRYLHTSSLFWAKFVTIIFFRLFWFPFHIFPSTHLHLFSAPNTMEIYFTRPSSDLHFTTSH